MKLNRKEQDYRKISYAQAGEDLIIKFVFDILKIERPTYIDVGAHHPRYINNTALLYDSGSFGINIEPDPELYKLFEKDRKNDINLNIGIGSTESTLDFYVLSTPTLNTFSKKEVRRYEKEGYTVKRVIRVKTKKINNIIKQYLGKAPDFLNLDAEGINLTLLKSFDFKKYAPKLICVETISFSESGRGVKDEEVIKYLESKDYLLYADTHINSIFVKKDLWVR